MHYLIAGTPTLFTVLLEIEVQRCSSIAQKSLSLCNKLQQQASRFDSSAGASVGLERCVSSLTLRGVRRIILRIYQLDKTQFQVQYKVKAMRMKKQFQFGESTLNQVLKKDRAIRGSCSLTGCLLTHCFHIGLLRSSAKNGKSTLETRTRNKNI